MQYLGTLPGADLIRILQDLVLGGQVTGELKAERTDRSIESVLTVREGHIVQATSSQYRERFGDLLVQRGIISQQQLEQALHKQRELGGKTPIGQLLVEMGNISAETIPQILCRQIEGVVYEILAWPEVRFQFVEGAVKGQFDLLIPISYEVVEGRLVTDTSGKERAVSVATLLHEAQENLPQLMKIKQAFHNPDESPKPAISPANVLLTLPQQKVLRLINGQRTFHQIVTASELDYLGTYQALFDLWKMGKIQVMEQSGTRAGEGRGTAAAPKMTMRAVPGPAPASSPTSHEELRGKLAEAQARIAQLSSRLQAVERLSQLFPEAVLQRLVGLPVTTRLHLQRVIEALIDLANAQVKSG